MSRRYSSLLAACVLNGLLVGAAGAQCDAFFPRLTTVRYNVSRTPPLDLGPSGVVKGDLDADGDLDLVASLENGGKLAVYKGHPDGTFDQVVNYTMTSGNNDIGLADLDGDGDLDVATVSRNSSGLLCVLLNDGTGAFGPQTTFPGVTTMRSIALADVNADGKVDAIAGGFSSSRAVNIFLGNGDGTFQPLVQYSGGGAATLRLVAGDIDGDGDVDVVTAAGQFDGASVKIFTNDGAGAFSVAATHPLALVTDVALADIDDDGDPDIVACANVSTATDPAVFVFTNNGAGVFTPGPSYTIIFGGRRIAVADLDADTDLDLLVSGGSQVTTLYNDGDGAFTVDRNYGTNGTTEGIAPADFDGNGTMDFATADNLNDTISVIRNPRGVMFDEHVTYGTADYPSSAVSADLDSNGYPDLAVANYANNTVSVFLNLSGGNFAAEVRYPTPAGPWSVRAADFDEDGDLDLSVSSFADGNVRLLLNNGNGTFVSGSASAVGGTPRGTAVGDVNSDGDVDIVSTNSATNDVSVLLGNGDGTFATSVPYGVGTMPVWVALGDIDGDTDLDMAVACQGTITIPGVVNILRNDGTGVFTLITTVAAPTAGAVALSNVDGDADNDLLYVSQNRLAVSFNNGSGVFTAPVYYSVQINSQSIVVVDFDRDGDLDVAIDGEGAGTGFTSIVPVMLNNGSGGFASRFGIYNNSGSIYVTAADFDQDGDNELVVVNAGISDNISVFNNDSPAPLSVSANPTSVEACLGGDVSFSVEVDGTQPITYQWRKDGVDIPKAYLSTYTIEGVTTGDVGSYDVVVSNACGSVTSKAAELTLSKSTCCAADWNHDGVVNSTDVSDFINQWFQDQVDGTLVADWDNNGVVNSTDVSDFINQWFEDQATCGG